MNQHIGKLRIVRVVAMGAALAAMAVGAVHAAIPGADGTINACYDKVSGQVRIVDPESNLPKPCGPKEIALSWNAGGAPGQDGQDGADGQDGTDGVSGLVRVQNNPVLDSNYDKTEYADCPSGTSVIGGGAGVYGEFNGISQEIIYGVALVQNHPFGTNGWTARASEFTEVDSNWYLSVYAICATVN